MELFYRHFGEGQPLIILHGVFGLSDNWVTFGRKLAERFSVFIPDQRNHGQSPHSSAFDYEVLSADLQEFIQRHEMERPVLVGHSMGGKVVMKYALEHPEEVDRLIVVDMSPRKYSPRLIHQRMIAAMQAVDFSRVDSRNAVEEELAHTIVQPGIRQFILKNLYRPERSTLAWRPNLDAISENLSSIFDAVSSAHPFPGPTLFVAGGESDYITEADRPVIRSLFPNSSIETIPGATHWVHSDAPDELCALFSWFLGKDCDFRNA
ncbi:MAG TPA: alpha/beta fold hydrolase [Bacteroidales bacterium]|nr:alpha/beta fold hydrolase [Bacteroidales bacterium]HRZ76254.1 alpha/beta fold hydrolase [Bacteroidales bacterium]